MLNAVKQSEENYIKEQEQVRVRDEQLRSARQTNRSDFNYLTLANSTPIRINNTRSDQPGYTSIQTQSVMFTSLWLTKMTNMNHP